MINGEPLIIRENSTTKVKGYYFKGEGDASIVIASATACPQKLYFKLSTYLAKNGFHVYTFDYSGIGESKSQPLQNESTTMQDWGAQDLNSALAVSLSRHQRTYLLTHSIGGQIFCYAENALRLSGVYCLASQSAYRVHWSGFSKLKVLLFWNVLLPISTRLWGYMPGVIMGSPESLSTAAAHSWKSFSKEPRGSLGLDKEALSRAKALQVPMKFIGLWKDQLLSPFSAVQALAEEFTQAQVKIELKKEALWRDLGHFDFFRSKHRDLWNDPLTFFQECEGAFKIGP